MSQWCKYYDCGWCYHPDTDYANGCIGITDCDIREPEIIATDTEDEQDE